jgi:hypothetical protein
MGNIMRLRASVLAAVAAVVLAASCAPSPRAPAASPASPRASASAGAVDPAAATAPRARKAPPPERPPPPRVTTALAGEPSSSALAEARLVTVTCEKASTAQIDARLREMRAAVAASFDEWHKEQPECWRQDREEYLERKREEASQGAIGYGGITAYGRGSGSSGAGAIVARPMAAPQAPQKRSSSGPRAATSASGTNNQVASVDEADIVKTDGKYVYLAANGALRVVEALKPRMVSVTKLPGAARELFVEGDRAVVYTSTGTAPRRCTYGYDCAFAGDGTSTHISVFDITDRAAPKLTRKIDLSGSLMASRRIGNAVHTVVADRDRPGPGYETWPTGLDMCGTPEKTVRARFAKMRADNERRIRAESHGFPTLSENGRDKLLCGGLMQTALRDGDAFTTLVSFDLTDDKAEPTTATMQSRPGAVFASADALYVSVVHRKGGAGGKWYRAAYASSDEVSELHKFHIGEKPKDTRYVGSGLVPGHVLNQFSMDEWYGYLRIATTKGKVPDPKVHSVVSVLTEGPGGNLVRVGAVDNIAPGEDIRAVRFDGDRGYVVTFKKTDPLFVMDLYQPAAPRILGELKIPGFSTYMHRIDADHLLSIGFDADDHGSFAYFDGVILQLFDVKNPTDPRLLHKEKIGSRGSTSEAATNHLAFNYFAERGLLAIPMTICDGGGDGRAGRLSFSGLLVYDVDVERGFKRLGGVDHGTKGVDCNTWWSHAQSAVKRSVFLDDLVYSIAGDRAKVQSMDRFGVDLADLSLTP